ncbi:MAG: hypothetical protein QOJ65_1741 [Fimbriimonadaceae bacterium]|nr:hypothetical protein [Fimbriimonadaceae bacterium]
MYDGSASRLETGLLKLKKLIFGVGLALCVVAPAAQSQNSAGVTFANDGGAIYVSAKDAAKALNLPLEYDSRSDLVFLGAIPLDHRSAVGNQRFVRLTALAKAGAKVRELAGGKTSIVLKGRELIVKTGRKRAVVDKKTQQLLVYQAGQLVMSSRVSTGRFAGSTPSGKFRMGYTKDAYHSSAKYNESPMPWAVHVTGNVFIHGYSDVPNRPASHGCVRLPMDAAEWFYRWVEPGTPVTIRG